ncbi:MAG: 2Fe-2S iron-sulfur cluster-binding protein [Eubacteriaceae bacterium]|nr:2Fe-2S iron-sulfur cluster-binding protein [Eubacteriaceae bacterium]
MVITIDGIECECEYGEFLRDIATRCEIEIPALCNHGGLPGQGCCRVCIVEVEIKGWKTVVASCIYPVEQECIVYTNSDKIKRQRAMVLSLMRARAPASKEIELLCSKFGASRNERFIEQEGEKCILCGLCAKTCESIGSGAISTINRGINKDVSTPYDEPSEACLGCGACSEICPTSAIEMEEQGSLRKIWGKAFDLVSCEVCGKPYATTQELDRNAKVLGEPASRLCDVCRRKAIADVLAKTFGS